MPVVVTLDQKDSRNRGLAPTAELLGRLNEDPAIARVVPFAQAAGDEIQGVFANAVSLLRVLQLTARQDGWWVGIGLGTAEVDTGDVRGSTGSAFLRAREALGRARKLPWSVAVEAPGPPGRRLDQAVALWYSVLLRRTDHGWRVAEMRDSDLPTSEIARQLGVSGQAVTKALRTADFRLDHEGRKLVADLLEDAERHAR